MMRNKRLGIVLLSVIMSGFWILEPSAGVIKIIGKLIKQLFCRSCPNIDPSYYLHVEFLTRAYFVH